MADQDLHKPKKKKRVSRKTLALSFLFSCLLIILGLIITSFAIDYKYRIDNMNSVNTVKDLQRFDIELEGHNPPQPSQTPAEQSEGR